MVNSVEHTQARDVQGVRLASAAAGIRHTDRDDLALVELAPGTETVAVFTQNKFCAAPVTVARANIAARRPRLLIFNSGNANAGTGEQGVADARQVTISLAKKFGCAPEEVLPFSTGVIGERLDSSKIESQLGHLLTKLAADQWMAAASAIMTTDTVAKYYSVSIDVDGLSYTATGMTKGSGMIHPNMATMLAFVAIDADIPAKHLDDLLRHSVNRSFNRITVDGDTSTNDACVLSATGKTSNGSPLNPEHPHWGAISDGIAKLFEYLAKSIVRDGEGATKFVEIIVRSPSAEHSLTIATTVAQSPLVKTALFASDPNWGRILAAVGRAPVAEMSLEQISISLDDYEIVRGGERVGDYDESTAAAIMAKRDICLTIEIGHGGEEVRYWTCDFSYDYVRINAEYRT